MMDAKSTPGPWFAVNNDSYWQIDSERDGQIGDACASLFDGTGGAKNWELCEANARLIAAAPDMLSALKSILADCEEYSRINNLHNSDGTPATNHSMRLARAAISKAEAA
ncbi:MAG: hypothetical protein E5X65_33905 [Mesorhizobium sp.]|nr:MAG: hypothetical protein E5X65_33905 [Mesorhizobium sp.]